jgi:hypothetical protein
MSRFVHDTPEHVMRKQFEIIFAKPVAERARMGFEMLAELHLMAKRRVERDYPHFSPLEVRLKVFEDIYRDDFTPEQLADIQQWMRDSATPQ